jgi:hypothetical protein
MSATDIVAYTYMADYHCPHCAEEAFGRAEDRSWVREDAVDGEGNPVSPVFESDEILPPDEEHDYLTGPNVRACDCGNLIEGRAYPGDWDTEHYTVEEVTQGWKRWIESAYSVLTALPGCLPDGEPQIADDLEEAREVVGEEIRAAFVHAGIEPEEPTDELVEREITSDGGSVELPDSAYQIEVVPLRRFRT